jgi:hypothetical protein
MYDVYDCSDHSLCIVVDGLQKTQHEIMRKRRVLKRISTTHGGVLKRISTTHGGVLKRISTTHGGVLKRISTTHVASKVNKQMERISTAGCDVLVVLVTAKILLYIVILTYSYLTIK